MATQLIQDRFPQLLKVVPELEKKPGTLLYVGANANRHHYMPEFYLVGHEITVLEVWQPYIDGIIQKEMIHHIVQGDVRKVDEIALGHNLFDYSFWWHGPGHIHKEELAETVARLERITSKIVILGCPWGIYPQGTVNGNPFETHESALCPEDFEELGYETTTLGKKSVIDSNIVSVKRLRVAKRRRRKNY